MRYSTFYAAMAIIFALCTTSASSQEKKMDMPGGVRGAFLKQSMFVEKHFVSLAEAIPAEKYTWRPAEGVRSIAECFLHTALGNYTCQSKTGGKLPEGIDTKTLEKSTTDKGKIIAELKKSFAVINEGVASIDEARFTERVDFFGMEVNVLDMIMLAATHQHELLGQAIAYARMNGVVPPWTEEMQRKAKEMEKKEVEKKEKKGE